MTTFTRSFVRARTAVKAVLAGVVTVVLVVAGTITANAAHSAPPAGEPAVAGSARPTVVLVHGAWADGSSWAAVAARLQQAGYPVRVPPNPLRGVAADSAYLSDYLRTIPGPIVLVGHSYGGFAVTAASAGNTNVKARVYVDAYIPDTGDSLASLGAKFPGSRITPESFDSVPVTGGAPDFYLKPEIFPVAMAGDLPRAVVPVLVAAQRPLSAAALTQPSQAPAASGVPTFALLGTGDQAIPLAAQEFMAERAGARITKVTASHLSPLSRPQHVVEVIAQAARVAR